MSELMSYSAHTKFAVWVKGVGRPLAGSSKDLNLWYKKGSFVGFLTSKLDYGSNS